MAAGTGPHCGRILSAPALTLDSIRRYSARSIPLVSRAFRSGFTNNAFCVGVHSFAHENPMPGYSSAFEEFPSLHPIFIKLMTFCEIASQRVAFLKST
jgi:hypothetical protein